MKQAPEADAVYLESMRDALARVRRYVGRKGRAAFLRDPLLQDAVIRNLEVVGEAAGRISRELAARQLDRLLPASRARVRRARGRQRFLAEIGRAGRERDRREALALAEESLAADNEALELAEGGAARQLKATHKARRRRR